MSDVDGLPAGRAGIGLCCGSIVQAGLLDFAAAAAVAGFGAITIWPTLYADAVSESSPAEVRRRLDDLGVRVIELDPVCSWLPVPIDAASMTGRFASFSVDDFLEMAEVLDSEALNVIRADTATMSDAEVIDHLGALADRAAARGRRIHLEFLPWSPVEDLDHAVRLVRGVDRANCGVHVDVWHHVRSGGTIDELSALEPRLVGAVQLSDLDPEPWDDLVAETSTGRRLPGEGDGSAAAAVAALDRAGVDAPMNLEVFSLELMAMPAVDAATSLGEAARRIPSPDG